ARMAKDSVAQIEREQKAKENLVAQNEFFEKNKSEPGVASTESGLQYITLAQGSGNPAKDGDTISVHYTGTLLDGTKFDSSLDRNQPLSITLGEGQLIPGWVEMLRLMKKGDKVKTWIPSKLAYGENGNPVIPGNSLLVFEMELLDIKPAKK
ncbi:MAG: FKBP-type peptidyl-prolyl cis-trans isomerase, partial [Fibromonadaceae bacterium]|nr:FKBP-type peptidyl-prolyl cis-trans isomerase [Fibromonadaceae bacterium]